MMGYVGFISNGVAAPTSPRAEKVVPVVTATVEQHELSQSITLIGKLAANSLGNDSAASRRKNRQHSRHI